jgi:hypothetical protein
MLALSFGQPAALLFQWMRLGRHSLPGAREQRDSYLTINYFLEGQCL